jgi:diguanylate cyclase
MTGSTPHARRTGGRRGRPLLRDLQLVAYAATGLCFVGFVLSAFHGGHGDLLDRSGTWLYTGTGVSALVTVAIRAVVDRAMRLPFAALACGLLLQSAGDTWWSVVLAGRTDVPFPSFADALYLPSYPCLYVCVLLMLRRAVRDMPPSMAMDAVIGACAVGAFAMNFAYDDLLAVGSGDPWAVVVGLAYPASDLVMLVVAASVTAVVGLRGGRVLWLVTAALVLWAVADSVYAVEMTAGTYTDGGPVDVLWTAASLLLATSAVTVRAPVLRRTSTTWWGVLVVPALFTLASLLLLGSFGLSGASHGVAAPLALGSVLVALVRTSLTFREVARLADARQEARTDDLTGLLNRRGFRDALHGALARLPDPDAEPGATVAVALVDLDRFKEVNDALGHQAGDELLSLVGARIRTCLGAGDTLARLGGDEFAAVVAIGSVVEAEAVAARLHAALQEPFRLEGISLHVTGSAGFSVFSGEQSGGTLLRQADVAMYDAKGAGVAYRFYDATTDKHSRSRLETIEELHRAVADDELVLHFQAKVDLREDRVRGVEALVRWNHPTRGLLYPDAFVALAEQTGLMRQLTGRVLEMALGQARRWLDQGRDLTVAVNISASNLLDTAFVEQVREALRRHDVPPESLVLELTESIIMTDPERGQEVVRRLHDLGVAVSIDDYGTGYSSLAYLRDLAVSELKLAREFVAPIGDDPRAEAIVENTVGLARSLGLTLVAEGVETAAALDRLTLLGCDLAQGYHFGRPCDASALEAWMDDRTGPGATASRDDRPVGSPGPSEVPAAGRPTEGRRGLTLVLRDETSGPQPAAADVLALRDDPVVALPTRRDGLAALVAGALPSVARPLAADDDRAHFWVRHLRLGIVLTQLASLVVIAYAVVGHRPAVVPLTVIAAGLMASAPFLLLLPLDRWSRGLFGVLFFYAWSLSTVGILVLATALDGGARSPLPWLLVLPLTYAGLAYPPLGVVLTGGVMVAADLVIGTMGPAAPQSSGVHAGTLAALTLMIAWASRNQWDLTDTQHRMARRLAELADTDTLTSCLNRRSFQLHLGRAAVVASPSRPLSLCMVDLDGFKSVNDTWGHAAGDALLVQVADGLRRSTRHVDVVARLGGDEFAVLLPDTTEELAAEVGERLRRVVAEIGLGCGVTGSIGVVTASSVAATQRLLNRADRVMYEAKRAGGDRAYA